jgi:hypothetical protein
MIALRLGSSRPSPGSDRVVTVSTTPSVTSALTSSTEQRTELSGRRDASRSDGLFRRTAETNTIQRTGKLSDIMTSSFAQRSRLASTLTTAGGTDYTAGVDASRSTIRQQPDELWADTRATVTAPWTGQSRSGTTCALRLATSRPAQEAL